MSHRESMSSVDTTWLRMDRPQNLMLIVGSGWWKARSLDRLDNQLAERQLTFGATATMKRGLPSAPREYTSSKLKEYTYL
jgi:hypothetical protein